MNDIKSNKDLSEKGGENHSSQQSTENQTKIKDNKSGRESIGTEWLDILTSRVWPIEFIFTAILFIVVCIAMIQLNSSFEMRYVKDIYWSLCSFIFIGALLILPLLFYILYHIYKSGKLNYSVSIFFEVAFCLYVNIGLILFFYCENNAFNSYYPLPSSVPLLGDDFYENRYFFIILPIEIAIYLILEILNLIYIKKRKFIFKESARLKESVPPIPKYCNNCGAPLYTLMDHCPRCGAKKPDLKEMNKNEMP